MKSSLKKHTLFQQQDIHPCCMKKIKETKFPEVSYFHANDIVFLKSTHDHYFVICLITL